MLASEVAASVAAKGFGSWAPAVRDMEEMVDRINVASIILFEAQQASERMNISLLPYKIVNPVTSFRLICCAVGAAACWRLGYDFLNEVMLYPNEMMRLDFAAEMLAASLFDEFEFHISEAEIASWIRDVASFYDKNRNLEDAWTALVNAALLRHLKDTYGSDEQSKQIEE